jgi:hypothetical protein
VGTRSRIAPKVTTKHTRKPEPISFPRSIDELHSLTGELGTDWRLVEALLELLGTRELETAQAEVDGEFLAHMRMQRDAIVGQHGALLDALHIHHAECFKVAADALLNALDFRSMHYVRARLRGERHVLDALVDYFGAREIVDRGLDPQWDESWYPNDGFGAVLYQR